MSKTKTISVRQIPTELWQLAKIEALKRGMSVPQFLVYALRSAVEPAKEKQ